MAAPRVAIQCGVRLALVLPDPAVHGPRWTDLAFEHRRHPAVRIVPSRAEADAWLASRRSRGAVMIVLVELAPDADGGA